MSNQNHFIHFFCGYVCEKERGKAGILLLHTFTLARGVN
ncbi:protein of unknown function [Xenorhabdus doucetiae]|uniref:Uncharacterized protein n=1 Tax=Xenorhabdus doucetiae TaxID=351671 RepID=A0A068QVG3_9GAMM|nr:protein of unknown function [Xenorhabdus doucetiae]